MSQVVFETINPATTSGTDLAGILDDFKDAVMSGFSGTSRPTETQVGGYWIDTTDIGSDILRFKIYDGTTDVEIFQVNTDTGQAIISGSEATFSITKVSADADGAILTMLKSRIASSGQVLDGDTIGQHDFKATASDGNDYTVGQAKVVANDNYTATVQGSYFSWSAIVKGAATLVEMMRLVDRYLGIGTTSPDASLHVLGTTGIKSERSSDDATGPNLYLQKSRVATTGAVQSSDVLGSLFVRARDSASAFADVAKIDAIATEGHTASAKGTLLRLYATKAGEASLTSLIEAGASGTELLIESKVAHLLNAERLAQQSIATGASITALNADKVIVNFTGSTATDLHGIDATDASRIVLLHNGSSAVITLKHQSSTETTAENRLKLPQSTDITIEPDASLELFYNTVDSRWKIRSGSGGGGGAAVVTSTQTLTTSGTISSSTLNARQLRYVQGTTTPTTISTTPFGTGGGWKDGTEMELIGVDNDASVILTYNDASYGLVGDFSTIEITKYKRVRCIWSNSLTRWILASNI